MPMCVWVVLERVGHHRAVYQRQRGHVPAFRVDSAKAQRSRVFAAAGQTQEAPRKNSQLVRQNRVQIEAFRAGESVMPILL